MTEIQSVQSSVTLVTKGERALADRAVTAARSYVKAESSLEAAGVTLGQRVAALFDAGLVGKGKPFAGMGAVGEFLTESLASEGIVKTFSLAYLASAVTAARAVEAGLPKAEANVITTLGTNADVSKAVREEGATAESIAKAITEAKAAKAAKAKAKAGEDKPRGEATANDGTKAKAEAPKAKAKRLTRAERVERLVSEIVGFKAVAKNVSPAEAKRIREAYTALDTILRDRANGETRTEAKAKA